MPKFKIALQGKIGAYSYLACQHLYPNLQALECHSFRDVMDRVKSGEAKYGMIPVENSTAGRVADVHNLLREMDVNIIREYFMPINHCLLAPKGTTLKTIKTVYSHVQALSQCDLNISKNGFRKQEMADTAGAAKWVSEQAGNECAAISSEPSAKEYGLEVLVNGYQDTGHNTTRFIVVSQGALEHSFDQGSYITTIVFKVKNMPAALYKVLGGFATNKVNVLKIESYFVDGGFKSTQFCMDIEAHIDEKRMKNAMKELGFFANSVKILGCYPAHKFRKQL
ncbi:MAG: prephenate dehydratase [Alphaproteobacteria bacterium]|jgi:prephenate dehydratase